jgi:hypothetical protein
MPLRHDISSCYELKATIEGLLGNEAWLELKECTSLPTWRKYVLRLIKAIGLSIEESVAIRDKDWIAAVEENLDRGLRSARAAGTLEELLCGFNATLLRQVFLQIGMLPSRSSKDKVTLRRENWRLNAYRSVQYVQSSGQQEAAFWCSQQQRIGVERQMELRKEYRANGSKLPFSEWCAGREA